MRLDTDIEPILSEAKRRDGDRLSLRDCAERGCGRLAADANAQAMRSACRCASRPSDAVATVLANGGAVSPGSKAKQEYRVANSMRSRPNPESASPNNPMAGAVHDNDEWKLWGSSEAMAIDPSVLSKHFPGLEWQLSSDSACATVASDSRFIDPSITILDYKDGTFSASLYLNDGLQLSSWIEDESLEGVLISLKVMMSDVRDALDRGLLPQAAVIE